MGAPGSTIATNVSSRFTDNVLRAGINYQFVGPVVAKYQTPEVPLAKPGLWPGSCHLGMPRLDRGNVVAWFSIVFAIMHATRVISSQAIERFAFLTRPNTRRCIG